MNRFFVQIAYIFAIIAAAREVNAQAGASPFDLLPRFQIQSDSVSIVASSNPFDIVPPIASSKNTSTSPGFSVTQNKSEQGLKDKVNILRRFQFGTILVMLVWMTLLFIIFRIFIVKVWDAFLNENILNQLMRERSPGSSLALLLFYLYFIYNTALYLFLSISELGYSLNPINIIGLLLLVGAVGLYILIKHFEWAALKTILPAKKELAAFSFTFMIFNIVIGLLLVPVILFIAYAPKTIKIYSIYGGAVVFSLVYLFLALRGLLLSGRVFVQNKIHFLLYLCAAEVAPVLLMIKLIKNYFEAA